MRSTTTKTHIHRFQNGLTGFVQVRDQRILRCDVLGPDGVVTRSPIEDLDYRWEFVRWLASIEADVESGIPMAAPAPKAAPKADEPSESASLHGGGEA